MSRRQPKKCICCLSEGLTIGYSNNVANPRMQLLLLQGCHIHT